MSKLNAYLPKYSSLAGADLHAATHDQLANNLTFSNGDWIKTDADYALVGTVEVTVTLLPREEAVQRHVVALRAQQANIRAAAHAQTVELERQINSLLAITHDSTSTEAA